MHYIQYIPGTIATITTHPTHHGHEDVNILSRFVAKFNTLLTNNSHLTKSRKVQFFVDFFEPFKL